MNAQLLKLLKKVKGIAERDFVEVFKVPLTHRIRCFYKFEDNDSLHRCFDTLEESQKIEDYEVLGNDLAKYDEMKWINEFVKNLDSLNQFVEQQKLDAYCFLKFKKEVDTELKNTCILLMDDSAFDVKTMHVDRIMQLFDK